MSYELVIGDEEAPEEAHFLGTTRDWGDFLRWVKGLPARDFAALRDFALSGTTTSGTAVAEQIGVALRDHPPEAPGVNATATEVADVLFDLPVDTRAGVVA